MHGMGIQKAGRRNADDNKELLFYERQKEIIAEIESLELNGENKI